MAVVTRRELAALLDRVTVVSVGVGGEARFRMVWLATPTGTVDGVNRRFVLPFAPAPPESLHWYVNGLLRAATTDFTLSGLDVLTVVAPQTGSIVRATFQYDSQASTAGFTVVESVPPHRRRPWDWDDTVRRRWPLAPWRA